MNRQIGSTLLVISTSLGISMLVLPFVLGTLGLTFSILLLVLAASLMIYTSLYILEINQWFPSGSSYITMARKTLGRIAGNVTWFLYLMFFYIIIAAYLSGGSSLLVAGLHNMADLVLPRWIGSVVWIVIISVAIFLGMNKVDKLNRLFFVLFVLSFAIVFAKGAGHIEPQLLTGGDPRMFFVVMPMVMLAFTFHFLIPSIRPYLRNNTTKVRKALISGGMIAFVIYLLWLILVFGIVPLTGGHSFTTIDMAHQPTTILMAELQWLTGSTWLALCVRCFIFFSLICAFLGISVSFFNFVRTSFSFSETPKNKLVTLMIMFVPPLLYAFVFPADFLTTVFVASIFIVLAFALLPALMVWSGRYIKGLSFGYTVKGGKVMLAATTLFTVFLLYSQLSFLFA